MRPSLSGVRLIGLGIDVFDTFLLRRAVSSSSLTMCSGAIPSQKNLSNVQGQAVYTNP